METTWDCILGVVLYFWLIRWFLDSFSILDRYHTIYFNYPELSHYALKIGSLIDYLLTQ